jgi:hypothetical protein
MLEEQSEGQVAETGRRRDGEMEYRAGVAP